MIAVENIFLYFFLRQQCEMKTFDEQIDWGKHIDYICFFFVVVGCYLMGKSILILGLFIFVLFDTDKAENNELYLPYKQFIRL